MQTVAMWGLQAEKALRQRGECNKKRYKAESVAQLVECLPHVHKALDSIPALCKTIYMGEEGQEGRRLLLSFRGFELKAH